MEKAVYYGSCSGISVPGYEVREIECLGWTARGRNVLRKSKLTAAWNRVILGTSL